MPGMDQAGSIDELAFQFFREFARCEYCLKAVGICKDTRDAKANWSGFANQVRDAIETPKSDAVNEAVKYYLQHPPKKQIIHEGRLDWDSALPGHANSAELVLLLVCRVRNNLFHGGKFNGQWFQPERSEQLLRHGLTILAECVNVHALVREAYVQRSD